MKSWPRNGWNTTLWKEAFTIVIGKGLFLEIVLNLRKWAMSRVTFTTIVFLRCDHDLNFSLRELRQWQDNGLCYYKLAVCSSRTTQTPREAVAAELWRNCANNIWILWSVANQKEQSGENDLGSENFNLQIYFLLKSIVIWLVLSCV